MGYFIPGYDAWKLCAPEDEWPEADPGEPDYDPPDCPDCNSKPCPDHAPAYPMVADE